MVDFGDFGDSRLGRVLVVRDGGRDSDYGLKTVWKASAMEDGITY